MLGRAVHIIFDFENQWELWLRETEAVGVSFIFDEIQPFCVFYLTKPLPDPQQHIFLPLFSSDTFVVVGVPLGPWLDLVLFFLRYEVRVEDLFV